MKGTIKEAVNDFNNQNGNKNINQKDLLIYIISKLDKFDDKLAYVSEQVEMLSTSQKFFKIALSGALSAIIFILGLLFKFRL